MSRILDSIDTINPGGAEGLFVTLVKALGVHGYQSFIVEQGKPGGYQHCRVPLVIPANSSFNTLLVSCLFSFMWRQKAPLFPSRLSGSNLFAALWSLLSNFHAVSAYNSVVAIPANEHIESLKWRGVRVLCS